MTASTPLAVTPLIASDPVRLEAHELTPAQVLAPLGLGDAERPGLLALAPGVELMTVLTARDRDAGAAVGAPARAAATGPRGDRVRAAVVLSGGIRESGRAARVAGRLRAACLDPRLQDRAARAGSREELVQALTAADHGRDESPLTAEELMVLLGSNRDGLGWRKPSGACAGPAPTGWLSLTIMQILAVDLGTDLMPARATTMTLARIVAAQVGNVFACRTDRESVCRVGLAANLLVFAGVGAEVGVLAALIAMPPLRARAGQGAGAGIGAPARCPVPPAPPPGVAGR